MDFFAHQDAARKRTAVLLCYYAAAVVVLVLATYFAALIAFHWHENFLDGPGFWQPKIFGGAALGTLGVISLGTVSRMLELRRGGSSVAQLLGGRVLGPGAVEPAEKQLRNVVEEMAIASGTPVPEIYVLEDEDGINAFAAGHTLQDAVIGVTRGTMQHLSRDELQGVVAHEFSHILNGDMRLNLRLMGVLHGIVCIFLLGRTLLRVRGSRISSSRRKGGNPLPLFGLLLMAIGGLGIVFGRLIQAAVSRQREFLADASAVQFTRNPHGIGGALKKIGGMAEGSRLDAPEASAASHLFFGNAVHEAWFSAMATHPPLVERIRRIEPSFDGRFPAVKSAARITQETALTRPPIAAPAFAAMPAVPRLRAPVLATQSGQSTPVHFAAELIRSLPVALRSAAGNSWNAAGIIFALVLSHDAGVRAQQVRQISALNSNLAAQVTGYAEQLAQQDARARLLLLNLALPALRTLSREQWQRMRAILQQLINCDAQVDLFEFALIRIVEQNIDAHFNPRKAAVIQFYAFNAVAPDCAVLLSALAHVGSADAAAVQHAFGEGAARLPFPSLPFVPAPQCGVQSIDAALSRLAHSVPHIRQTVLDACAHTVACDGWIRAEEGELLRAIAESLGCPLPPAVTGL
jgi:Zn-dependent protease with chaperone function